MTSSNSFPHIAFATCAALPELDDDDRLVAAALRRRGALVTPAVWDDGSVDWQHFDLVVIRSTWDYTSRRAEFLAWARAVPRLANPAEAVAWNTDKRYLADLGHAGLPVVPTTWLEPGDEIRLPADGAHVIKPSVGAGSFDVDRFALEEPGERARATAHAARLLAAGRAVVIQPYVGGIERHGETGVILLGGLFSHAIGKGPMLGGHARAEVAGLYKAETITGRVPSAAELEIAQRVLKAVPGGAAGLTYARVDLVPGPDDQPLILELELTEPSLFMGTAAGSEERFANAILDRL